MGQNHHIVYQYHSEPFITTTNIQPLVDLTIKLFKPVFQPITIFWLNSQSADSYSSLTNLGVPANPAKHLTNRFRKMPIHDPQYQLGISGKSGFYS
ncbi:hypothetical protein HanRHA438_Chr05g0218231 [Helianthus annuus]|nr:hypothetical protein HanRHA438_Chr05g0218231 [Helianthus annuus]